MATTRKAAIIGFDSISLSTLLQFVDRGVMPNVARLIRDGCVTQTWPCYPMETGTNWACLATGASPWVTGCNMSLHLPGDPLDRWQRGFPAELCKAEQLWTAARRGGKRSVVFDWSQSYPLASEDSLIHIGEDGRPDNAIRALQEVRAYATHPRAEGPHVTRIELRPAPVSAPAAALAFDVPIDPGPASRYRSVSGLRALVLKGEAGYDRVALYADRSATTPLFEIRLDEWSDWVLHEFSAGGRPVTACLRGKLLILEPDASKVHLYLSEIYCQEDFVHPVALADDLLARCGPSIIQCSRQQVVQGGASDIATYFEEQEYLARWWRTAAEHVLSKHEWDLFMLKWHGPDWTNHLTMYMIDPRHPMYEPGRAAEGWALWDRLMGWGDAIVGRVLDVAGDDAVVALVSDHGGGTQIPGTTAHPDPNPTLAANGWLCRKPGGAVDWSRTVAFGRSHYVFLNLKGRDPAGTVEPGADYAALRDDIIQALLSATKADGRHLFHAVLPVEEAGRLGVGGERVGDIFLIPCQSDPRHCITPAEFLSSHSVEEVGTWDWPRLNAGSHLDDSYFVLAGPGVRRGYRRPRPAPITSVAPTVATAVGIPVPTDADGAVLHDFLG